MAKNLCGKRVTRENAYEIWRAGTWTGLLATGDLTTTYECGCSASMYSPNAPSLLMCRMHEIAPDLSKEALGILNEILERSRDGKPIRARTLHTIEMWAKEYLRMLGKS